MTTETLEKLHSVRPFVPYVLNMADGRKFRVDHPDALAFRKGIRMAVLLTDDGAFEHIDLFLVTSATEGRTPRRKSA